MRHKQKSSERFLDNDKIIGKLDIKGGQTIVDAGFGTGYMSLRFADLAGADGQILSIELNADQVDAFNGSGLPDNIFPICADITNKIPMSDSSADLIYMSNVFHIFSGEKLDNFLKEAKRVLKPDGLLAVVDIVKEETGFGPPMNMRYTSEEVVALSGMEHVETTTAGEFFYLVLLK